MATGLSVLPPGRGGSAHPYAPFTGVLLLPNPAPAKTALAVSSGDGEPLVTVRWPHLAVRSQFEILDAHGGARLAGARLAQVGPDRFGGFQIRGADVALLLQFEYGLSGPTGWWTVTLPDGRRLTVEGNRSRTTFPVRDEAGRQVAQILTGNRAWGPPQSQNLVFELHVPVLSIVQAVGLAQGIRAAGATQRG